MKNVVIPLANMEDALKEKIQVGEFVQVKIVGGKAFSLEGKIIL